LRHLLRESRSQRTGHKSLFFLKTSKNHSQALARPTVKTPHHSQAAAFSELGLTTDPSEATTRLRWPQRNR
jgi:hypothetical protein